MKKTKPCGLYVVTYPSLTNIYFLVFFLFSFFFFFFFFFTTTIITITTITNYATNLL